MSLHELLHLESVLVSFKVCLLCSFGVPYCCFQKKGQLTWDCKAQRQVRVFKKVKQGKITWFVVPNASDRTTEWPDLYVDLSTPAAGCLNKASPNHSRKSPTFASDTIPNGNCCSKLMGRTSVSLARYYDQEVCFHRAPISSPILV